MEEFRSLWPRKPRKNSTKYETCVHIPSPRQARAETYVGEPRKSKEPDCYVTRRRSKFLDHHGGLTFHDAGNHIQEDLIRKDDT
ncbi:hypothetical protein E2562_022729 [Oryza meyeriana var. granulata]|uniref:Uncharacterized protein n=1 Tax=Oryza meyeriana var. granulata TaxID=110450 RepID=A0A6G1FBA0_9ORYZ|nr:hypothetical protein E2562_022729 [Oryza meyeriana var. granulata]